jgi:hypothetical protein
MVLFRHLELLVLALALPVFLIGDLPILGWVVGGGAGLAQLAIRELTIRRATATEDVRTRVGWIAGSMIARGWLVALTILAVGLADNDAGLAAAVLFLALLTVHFTIQMILRPFDDSHSRSVTP